MKKTFLILLTAIIFCSIFMSSCGEKEKKPTATTAATTTAPTTPPYTYKVKGTDYSYRSKLAKINYPEVPYYGYTDPLETLFDKNYKKAVKHSIFKSNNNVEYRDFENGVEVSRIYTNSVVHIPEEIDGKPVLKLGGEITDYEDGGKTYRESTYDTGINQIYLPSTIRDIVFWTFEDMSELSRIDVSEDNPYYSSENGILYNKDKSVLLCIPQNNPAKTINISENTKTMYALFSGKSETVNIPKSVTKITNNFYGTKVYNLESECNIDTKLSAINVAKDNERYSSIDGVLYNKKQTILYAYPRNRKAEVLKVPDTVKRIERMYLDYTDNLREIDFGKNINKIGFDSDPSMGGPDFNIIVKGYKNTSAEKWAKDYEVKFFPLD